MHATCQANFYNVNICVAHPGGLLYISLHICGMSVAENVG